MNSLWIHYCFRGITVTSLSASQFYYESTINFVISLKNHLLFCEINMNSVFVLRIVYESISKIHLESLWNKYLFRDSTMNSLSFTRNKYEFTIYFAISLLNHCLFGVFTLNSLSYSRFYSNPLSHSRYHYVDTFLREITMNSLFCCNFTMNTLCASR